MHIIFRAADVHNFYDAVILGLICGACSISLLKDAQTVSYLQTRCSKPIVRLWPFPSNKSAGISAAAAFRSTTVVIRSSALGSSAMNRPASGSESRLNLWRTTTADSCRIISGH